MAEAATVKLTGEEVAMPIDPHASAPQEDPEEHVGEEIPDPWDDPEQTDWPNETVDVNGRAGA